jgi:hypothetical protein
VIPASGTARSTSAFFMSNTLRDAMLENPTATNPTVALTRDILNRIEFGKARLDEYDHRDPAGGRRIKGVVPVLLDGRQIGTAKIDILVLTSNAPDANGREQIRQLGYASSGPRGNEQIEWAVEVAESKDRGDLSLDQAEKQILAAARSQINLES